MYSGGYTGIYPNITKTPRFGTRVSYCGVPGVLLLNALSTPLSAVEGFQGCV